MVERKYENRWVTSITFEKSVFDRVSELLPKGTTIPDLINEMLKERLSDLEREQKIKDGLVDKSAIRIYDIAENRENEAFNYILQSEDDELLGALRMLGVDKREKVMSKLHRNYMRCANEEENELRAENIDTERPLTEDEYKIVQEYSHPSIKATEKVWELRDRLRKYGKQ